MRICAWADERRAPGRRLRARRRSPASLCRAAAGSRDPGAAAGVNYADMPTVTVGPGALGEAHGSNGSLAAAELLDAIKALVSLATHVSLTCGKRPHGTLAP